MIFPLLIRISMLVTVHGWISSTSALEFVIEKPKSNTATTTPITTTTTAAAATTTTATTTTITTTTTTNTITATTTATTNTRTTKNYAPLTANAEAFPAATPTSTAAATDPTNIGSNFNVAEIIVGLVKNDTVSSESKVTTLTTNTNGDGLQASEMSNDNNIIDIVIDYDSNNINNDHTTYIINDINDNTTYIINDINDNIAYINDIKRERDNNDDDDDVLNFYQNDEAMMIGSGDKPHNISGRPDDDDDDIGDDYGGNSVENHNNDNNNNDDNNNNNNNNNDDNNDSNRNDDKDVDVFHEKDGIVYDYEMGSLPSSSSSFSSSAEHSILNVVDGDSSEYWDSIIGDDEDDGEGDGEVERSDDGMVISSRKEHFTQFDFLSLIELGRHIRPDLIGYTMSLDGIPAYEFLFKKETIIYQTPSKMRLKYIPVPFDLHLSISPNTDSDGQIMGITQFEGNSRVVKFGVNYKSFSQNTGTLSVLYSGYL
ncbi:hypothetical protein HELRODRAFT_173501 [Helobdella robusta]|uniref:Uncharacterized protein n=1 Tax=Helobdella robusta TaxID=6412 RepID=T1F6W6_HELRO|nr:hypothetical protein HELRODRAFT_173501 [Helobdella robusta]ESO03798.1 hypothetical protein HELRODRAFT_173501 [Helobdella robusta]